MYARLRLDRKTGNRGIRDLYTEKLAQVIESKVEGKVLVTASGLAG